MTSQPNRKAFVLLSGGADSTTCLHQAILDYAPQVYEPGEVHTRLTRQRNVDPLKVDWVEAVSIDYGQRHKKEMDYAKRTADSFQMQHTVVDVGNLLSGKSVMLSQESVDTVSVPNISYSDIRGVSPTYVPFRNGLILSAITAHAQKWVNEKIDHICTPDRGGETSKESATALMKDSAGIYFGAHADDALNWAYPDCTPEFIGSMANAIYIGSYFCIRLHTPIQWMLKQDIILLGKRIGVRFEDTWSCYKGEELHCGVCPTCRSRRDAFIIAGTQDPTEYASPNPAYSNPVDELEAVADGAMRRFENSQV